MDGKPHIHEKEQDGSCAWCVTDDFPAHIPVQSVELDAIEAFLMPCSRPSSPANSIPVWERSRVPAPTY